jgi:hypothetical protein
MLPIVKILACKSESLGELFDVESKRRTNSEIVLQQMKSVTHQKKEP